MKSSILVARLLLIAALLASPMIQAMPKPCKPIDSLPANIKKPGHYCLVKNLSTGITSGNAITIKASNVVLDLGGFRLSGLPAGNDTQAFGIYASGRKNITIRGGLITGFKLGIALEGDDSSSGHLIENNHLDRNTVAGIIMYSHSSIIRANRISHSGSVPGDHGIGIYVSGGVSVIIEDNHVFHTYSNYQSSGIVIWYSPGAVIRGNTVAESSGLVNGAVWGIIVADGSHLTSIENNLVLNSVAGSYAGIDVQNSGEVSCRDNTTKFFIIAMENCVEIDDSNIFMPIAEGVSDRSLHYAATTPDIWPKNIDEASAGNSEGQEQ